MPITKSAKKALRQNLKRRKGNLFYKDAIRKLLKQGKSLISSGNFSKAQELLPKIYKALDKAAKKGVIKKNTAARKKSRITKQVSKISNK